MQEVRLPEEVTFPYAVARDLAIKNMTGATEPLPAPPPSLPLPFAAEAGEPDVPDAIDVNTVVPQAPKFKITLSRIWRYDTTPGCRACKEMNVTSARHAPECRVRFRALMEKDRVTPSVNEASVVEEPPADVAGPPPNFLNTSEPSHAPDSGNFGPEELHGDGPRDFREGWNFGGGDEAAGGDELPEFDMPPLDGGERGPAPATPFAPAAQPSASKSLASKLARPPEVVRGLIAACDVIDKIRGEALKYCEEVEADALFNIAVDNVRVARGLPAGERSTRPSSSLPGWLNVVEINLTGNNSMSSVMSDYDLTHCEVHSPRDLVQHIKQRPGCYSHEGPSGKGVVAGRVVEGQKIGEVIS